LRFEGRRRPGGRPTPARTRAAPPGWPSRESEEIGSVELKAGGGGDLGVVQLPRGGVRATPPGYPSGELEDEVTRTPVRFFLAMPLRDNDQSDYFKVSKRFF
jgi:hypothetical protein